MLKIEEFLSKDKQGIADQHFNTTRFISDILLKKQDVIRLLIKIKVQYDQLCVKENECETLMWDIVEQKYETFNPLIAKPATYGKAYEELTSLAKQNRRRIEKCKELLEFKSSELTQNHLQSFYNKEILHVLDKIASVRQSIELIDQSEIYEGCLEYSKAKGILDSMDYQKSLLISNLNLQLNERAVRIINTLKTELQEYFFGVLQIPQDALKYHQCSEKIKINCDINILKLTLPESNDVQRELQSYAEVKEFLDACFTFDQISEEGALRQIFTILRSATLLSGINNLLNAHFRDFKTAMQDFFNKRLAKFILSCRPRDPDQDKLYAQLSFSEFNMEKVSCFFQNTMVQIAIILRKQIIFGKIMQQLHIDIDENTQLMSIGELTRQLYWQANMMFSLFYKKSVVQKRELLDARNELHLLLGLAIQKLIGCSPLYLMLQSAEWDDCVKCCIQKIQIWMQREIMFQEPMDNELILQEQLRQSIFQECWLQLSSDLRETMRFMANKPFQPQLQQIEFDCLKVKFTIPEIFSAMQIIGSLQKLSERCPMPQILNLYNHVLGVTAYCAQQKFKQLIQGSKSYEILREKEDMLKTSKSYLIWKIQNQQSNELLNDGIDTQARLDASNNKKSKQQAKASLYQGYKEFLIGRTHISEQQLIRSKETLHSICALHDNIHALIQYVQGIFWKFLDSNKVSSLGDDQSPMGVVKKYLKLKSADLPLKNVFDVELNEDLGESLVRFHSYQSKLLTLQRDAYLILRLEFHLRILSMESIQSFYFEHEVFTQTVHVDVQTDFWMVFKGALKARFIREKDFSSKKINMILKDLVVLKQNLPNSEKKIQLLRRYQCILIRYFKLYLVNPVDLEKFLKLNPFKYKQKQIVEYTTVRGCQLQDLKKYCL